MFSDVSAVQLGVRWRVLRSRPLVAEEPRMLPRSRHHLKVAAVAVVLGTILAESLALWINHHTELKNQQAEALAARIMGKLSAIPEYHDVDVRRFSGFGAIRVGGTVGSQKDMDRLHGIIEPAVPHGISTFWQVELAHLSPAATEISR